MSFVTAGAVEVETIPRTAATLLKEIILGTLRPIFSVRPSQEDVMLVAGSHLHADLPTTILLTREEFHGTGLTVAIRAHRHITTTHAYSLRRTRALVVVAGLRTVWAPSWVKGWCVEVGLVLWLAPILIGCGRFGENRK